MASIQVVIVSTSALTRAGLKEIINQSGARIEVVGLFDMFSEAEEFLDENKVRVLLADDSHQTVNLIKTFNRLIDRHPGLVIIFIMQRPAVSLLDKLVRLGVRALLHKEDDLENTLNHTIQTAVMGSTTISPRIAAALERASTLPANISQRDLDMLQMLTEGLDAKVIAARLGVKYDVVNRALKRMEGMYGAQNRHQLAVIAHQILSARHTLGDEGDRKK
jgi:DNA-binding NarL/FixJ family response regulator